MPFLICEGMCNPALPTFDALAADYTEASIAASGDARVTDTAERIFTALVAARKRLQHTDHQRVIGNRYVCLTCGAERKYGPAYSELRQDWRQTA